MSLKKSEQWSLTLEFTSPNHSAILNSLHGEDVLINNQEGLMTIHSRKANDLRGRWNSLARTLIVSEEVLKVK
jgi:hypothetical protein